MENMATADGGPWRNMAATDLGPWRKHGSHRLRPMEKHGSRVIFGPVVRLVGPWRDMANVGAG